MFRHSPQSAPGLSDLPMIQQFNIDNSPPWPPPTPAWSLYLFSSAHLCTEINLLRCGVLNDLSAFVSACYFLALLLSMLFCFQSAHTRGCFVAERRGDDGILGFAVGGAAPMLRRAIGEDEG